ncbi:MAG: hypothetical protein NTV19_00295 [Burkholderiales bacterium]|nr:hypothetical protein [Burkholderiales bacterium]
MTVLLLAGIQLLAPFVHAHAGATATGGWHLHTAAQAAGSAFSPPAQPAHPTRAEPLRVGQWQPSPAGADSPEVGIVTGIAQPRQTTVPGEAATPLGGAPATGAGSNAGATANGTALLARLPAPPGPVPAHQGRPGMPPLPHGPPARA